MMEIISARELFEKNRRFDLIYKILYLENIGENNEIKKYYEKLYSDSIKYFNNFYEEYPLKKTKEDFLRSFNDIYINMVNNGFDDGNPIPVNSDNQLYDGAHRLSSAYVLGQDVTITRKDHDDLYDYKFFENNKMPLYLSDIGALEYVKHNPRAHIVQVFPVVKKKYDEYIENILNQYGFVYYKKEINVNYNALVKIKQINYGNELWAGDSKNDYCGLKQHALKCLGFSKMRVYIFVCDDINDAIIAKRIIRNKFMLGDFPVHINDNHIEAERLAEIYFRREGIDWLNSVSYSHNRQLEDISNEFLKYCISRNKNINKICIAGSSVLTLYDLRRSEDIDCIFIDGESVEECGNISSHESERKYYPDSFNNLIYRHQNYITINGIKFLTLRNIMLFKLKRHEWYKDYRDIWLICMTKRMNKFKMDSKTAFYYLPKIKIKSLIGKKK